jgi:hypothetical protein
MSAQPAVTVISAATAAEELERTFGVLVDADYVTGKTQFRDALCASFGVSQLEAEELCDDLERAEVIRFVDSPELGTGWSIDASVAKLG